MNFAKKVAESYEFVLKDLKSDEKHMIRALTGLAIEDGEFYDTIGRLIMQHIYKVSKRFFCTFIISFELNNFQFASI